MAVAGHIGSESLESWELSQIERRMMKKAFRWMARGRGERRSHWQLGSWKIQFFQRNKRVSTFFLN